MKSKAKLYLNPKAPEGFRNMMRELFPDADEVSAEKILKKFDTARRLNRAGADKAKQRPPRGGPAA
jgi:hypothetical protein